MLSVSVVAVTGCWDSGMNLQDAQPHDTGYEYFFLFLHLQIPNNQSREAGEKEIGDKTSN